MNVVKKKEPIPDHFNDDEEAGNFWDTHSTADYWDEMEEVEIEFDIKKRKFLVPIDERLYQLVKNQAKKSDCTVEQIINTMLDHNFVEMK